MSHDAGDRWEEIDPGTISTDVTSLTVLQDTLFAGTRFAGFADADWPRSGQRFVPGIVPNLNSRFVDLDAVYPQILPHSWLVCLNQEQFQPLQVASATTALMRGFTLESQVSRIALQTPATFNNIYPPQTTIVLANSELLALADLPLDLNHSDRSEPFQDPIGHNSVYLSQFVQGYKRGKS
ncbi:MAG: hypothetical protein HC936_05865 [Leptolyngbyaceae cyanobacterium SU_3_3]|nr:hypothetical protein [Leptolyngbyaceae cyanobacterium SU_3_3]